ncbi:two-component sensor histidine kinase [Streptomyces sp. A7024]|uniref:histidine kinase n=1 Tax=Streptomyces coryli TaxID=1128680 RepID=A0A6G4TWL9_9ACTN|nr:histidine kinase [Streptomyces coryli]NGN63508.1 two-component sensor histidine kinase [Streptomyces coryli]
MRSRRDWYVDIAFFLFAVVFSLVTADSVHLDENMSRTALIVDQVVGGLGCAAIFLRRRWPVPLALVLLVLGSPFHFMTGATLVAFFTVAAHRSLKTTAWVCGAFLLVLVTFLVRGADREQAAIESAVTYFVLLTCAISWGLYVRARRTLLTAQKRQAAADARREAREEIAREMHDVLAHRLSLLSVHAGALEFNPGAPAADVQRAAGVIRESAHQALQDLREVIGVLRAPAAGVDGMEGRPQPTLADVERLLAESREAGARITYEADVADPGAVPAATGRAAYRIVQEGLTNARKHAPGAEVTVRIAGTPTEGLTVELRNALPGAAGPAAGAGPGKEAIPGARQGLIGLTERAHLAGGRLEHGRVGDEFRLSAWLPWPAGPAAAAPPPGSAGATRSPEGEAPAP